MDSFRFRVRLELESEENHPDDCGAKLAAAEVGTRLSEPPDMEPSWIIGNDIGRAVVNLNEHDWHASLRTTLSAFDYVIDLAEGLDPANTHSPVRSDREMAAINAIREAIRSFDKFLDLVDPPRLPDDDDE